MEKYRFKTLREMELEYGKSWRSEALFNKEGYMDYLLNRPIDNKYILDMYSGRTFHMPASGIAQIKGIYSWSIHPNAYKRIEPEFKNGIMIINNGLLKSKY